MSAQHTPGQLLTAGDYPNGQTSICTHTGTGWREVAKAEADARRLVACWNACLEVPTELLENLADDGATIAPIYRDLIVQRDELLAALKVMLRDYAAVHDIGDLELQPAIYQARAAIAKAEAAQ